ncbi:MAG: cytochrome b, partial [Gammaproteobacteria bacterium]|nr:cytochrome b [Gammaproteobacteria bacterium]
MSANGSTSEWNRIAQWLHWLVAALIVTQFVLGQLAEAAAAAHQPARQLALLANHKSVGITVLALAIVRLGWRWASTVPDLPAAMPRWQVRASKLTHWLLYLLIFALPVSGWLMSSASAYTVSWFNLVELPDLVSPDETLKEQLVSLHHLLATTLFVLATGHLIAALKHHFLDRDTVLARMLTPTTMVLFVVVAGAAIWGSTRIDAGRAKSPGTVTASPASQPIEIASEVEPWPIDYSASFIGFEAEQAGAAFTGTWPVW